MEGTLSLIKVLKAQNGLHLSKMVCRTFQSSSSWNSKPESSKKRTVIPPSEVQRFCRECMMAVGTIESHANQLAEVLMAADYRGHFSHGMNRLGMHDVNKRAMYYTVGGNVVTTRIKILNE